MARCRFIDAEKASEGNSAGHSVAFLCRVLGVPRCTYYAHRASRPARTVRERAEEVLVGEIRVLHAGSRGAYGVPRIHAALRRAGRVVNSKKIERLMRKHRIVGITRRRRRGLTRQAKRAVFALDLIGRDFTAPRPGMRLVGDMTELSTLEGKLYLATCIDLATREVVGWAMADHHRAELLSRQRKHPLSSSRGELHCLSCPVAWCEQDSGDATPEEIRQVLLAEHGPARLRLTEPEASAVPVLRALREVHSLSLAQARSIAAELKTTGIRGDARRDGTHSRPAPTPFRQNDSRDIVQLTIRSERHAGRGTLRSRKSPPAPRVEDAVHIASPLVQPILIATAQDNGRKRHITVDTLGLPVMITVTPADIQDRDAARDVFWRLRLTQPQITQVWADRGYAGELVDWARERLWLTLRIVCHGRRAVPRTV
ncbi:MULTISPECIES: IS3 family transposase [Streptomyces]|uniref:IS3 family transposase n=1 Tax=Streptomyces TaxID=1883 RepID=UPI000A3715A8